jgi:glycosyltransferase involved in cell wall biosynthesis
MNLVYIHQYFKFPSASGGTRSYDLAKSFVARGVDVTIITSNTVMGENYGGNKKKWTLVEKENLKIWVLDCKYSKYGSSVSRILTDLKFSLYASIKLLKIKTDVVLATSTPLTIAIPALCRKMIKKTPFVFEVRDVWPGVPIAMGVFKNAYLQKVLYAFEKHIYRKAAAIVPLSTGMDDNIKQRYPNDKSVVIPNISEVNRFNDIKKEVDIEVPEGKKVLLYAGTLGNVNGVGYIVEMAAQTIKYNPNVWYYLVGAGKEKESIISQAKELGVLNKNVFFFTPVKKNDLPYLYSIVTVGSSFVIDIPALWDNSANKFFDTLAARRPMVINHEGWQADAIREYNCGYVLPPKVSEDAAKAFVEYMTNEALLKKQGENAFALAKEKYSLEVATEKYMGIFDRIYSK